MDIDDQQLDIKHLNQDLYKIDKINQLIGPANPLSQYSNPQ
jgi:hypothetical protein